MKRIYFYILGVITLLFIFSNVLTPKPLFDLEKSLRWLAHNYGEVEKGKCYRFWQLKPSDLEKYIKDHKLRIIVNLRGMQANRDWYRQQIAIAKKHGAKVISAALDPDKYPPKKDFFIVLATIYNPKALLELKEDIPHSIDELKKIILDPNASTKDIHGHSIALAYHCLYGADRTGLAVALRSFEQCKGPGVTHANHHCVKDALKHLTLKFRHFRKLHPKMKETIEKWAVIRSKNTLAQALELYPY